MAKKPDRPMEGSAGHGWAHVRSCLPSRSKTGKGIHQWNGHPRAPWPCPGSRNQKAPSIPSDRAGPFGFPRAASESRRKIHGSGISRPVLWAIQARTIGPMRSRGALGSPNGKGRRTSYGLTPTAFLAMNSLFEGFRSRMRPRARSSIPERKMNDPWSERSSPGFSFSP
jgi:hypothetical protein